jgi:hypothetical protein
MVTKLRQASVIVDDDGSKQHRYKRACKQTDNNRQWVGSQSDRYILRESDVTGSIVYTRLIVKLFIQLQCREIEREREVHKNTL